MVQQVALAGLEPVREGLMVGKRQILQVSWGVIGDAVAPVHGMNVVTIPASFSEEIQRLPVPDVTPPLCLVLLHHESLGPVLALACARAGFHLRDALLVSVLLLLQVRTPGAGLRRALSALLAVDNRERTVRTGDHGGIPIAEECIDWMQCHR